MTNTSERPLVSFCQMNYNQKDYVVSSLQGALAQTYSPLEIIISDDASTDGSWQVILDIVSSYKGPHAIITNRNDTNLGLVGNWNKLCSMASGELLVKGDGDDISLSNRVERLVHEWMKYEKVPLLLSSSYIKIDMEGRSFDKFMMPIDGWDDRDKAAICGGTPFFHIGAASAYSRTLYDTFGPVKYPKAVDDATYEGRAALLGRLVGIKDELVLYRVGSGNTTGRANYRASMIRGISLGLYARYQLIDDLDKIKDRLSSERYEQMKGIFERSVDQHKTSLQLWSGKTFGERFSGYRKLSSQRNSLKTRYIQTVLLMPDALSNLFFQLPLRLKRLVLRE